MWQRLRFRFRRQQLDHDLRAEMEQHINLLTAELVAQGMSLEEASLAARRKFGNVTSLREQSRDHWGFPSFESLLQDVRFGSRMLRRSAGFTVMAVLTLALGIGANTAVFSVVNATLLRSLHFPEPDRLVTVWGAFIPAGTYLGHVARSRTMDLAAYSYAGLNLSGEGKAIRLDGALVSANFFSVLGSHAALGRTFLPEENTPGRDRIVILSHALWRTRFNADPNIVGRSITLDGTDRVVVGVMPETFEFPTSKVELWAPFNTLPENLWGAVWVKVVGRLRPGVSLSEARAELAVLVPQLAKLIPWHMPTDWGKWAVVIPLQEQMVEEFRAKLLILWGVTALVLLIACANVANLLLARAAGRQREIAVRSALGAAPSRIVRQLITESVLLALLGGSVGLLLAPLGTRLLWSVIPSDVQFTTRASLDWRVLASATAVAVLTGIIFGLAPALPVYRIDLEQTIKANTRSSMTRERRRLSASLVIVQTALAVVLAVAAGLLVRSLWQLSHEQIGFHSDGLVSASLTPSPTMCATSYGDTLTGKPGRCDAFYGSLLASVRSQPGVQDAAFADILPFGNIHNTVLAIDDNPQYTSKSPYQSLVFCVSPGYFQTLAVPLLKGRTFSEDDAGAAPGVAIVTRSFAQRIWPGQDPIGKRVKPSWMKEWRTIVGVVSDVRLFGVSPGTWADPTAGAIYFPYRQGIVGPSPWLNIVIRTSSPAAIASALPNLAASINSTVPVTNVQTMQQAISESIAVPRSTMWLFAAFATLALTLGAIGIYSVISYSVAARTQEIGIRMALGADRATVLRRILGRGLALAAIGVGIGLVAAFALTRVLRSLLYGVQPSDPATFISVAVILIVVALAASYLPARRAASIDPVTALRYE
jgi:predicted permease